MNLQGCGLIQNYLCTKSPDLKQQPPPHIHTQRHTHTPPRAELLQLQDRHANQVEWQSRCVTLPPSAGWRGNSRCGESSVLVENADSSDFCRMPQEGFSLQNLHCMQEKSSARNRKTLCSVVTWKLPSHGNACSARLLTFNKTLLFYDCCTIS